jgi:hypothetical protein
MLSGHDGSVAPGVYHRYGDPTDAHGSREEHVLEAYPESPYASKITAQGAQHQPEKGNPIPRVAFFVGAQPEHHSHYAQFYTARDQMHRAQAAKE